MTWATLFDRADATAAGVTVEAIRAALADRRKSKDDRGEAMAEGDGDDSPAQVTPPETPNPATVVADADVLAADLLVGGDAREALDIVRSHDWIELVASDPLLDDAAAVVATHADETLATAWRDQAAAATTRVSQPPGDHPGLASAAAGGAAHLLTLDEGLSSAGANLSLKAHVAVSVRTPHAFVTVFDPERLYPAVVGGEYPGPDADPRE